MPKPGDDVRVAMRKWVDTPHWTYDAVYLGADDHGDWIGLRTGAPMRRPGRDLRATHDMVTLAPHGDTWWVATFHPVGLRDPDDPAYPDALHTYVDISTPPSWLDAGAGDRPTLTAVDLDLDVVRTLDGFVWIDDEDEFVEHRVELGYPPEVITAAERAAAEVLDAVLAERAPYDGTAQRWFVELDRWS